MLGQKIPHEVTQSADVDMYSNGLVREDTGSLRAFVSPVANSLGISVLSYDTVREMIRIPLHKPSLLAHCARKPDHLSWNTSTTQDTKELKVCHSHSKLNHTSKAHHATALDHIEEVPEDRSTSLLLAIILHLTSLLRMSLANNLFRSLCDLLRRPSQKARRHLNELAMCVVEVRFRFVVRGGLVDEDEL